MVFVGGCGGVDWEEGDVVFVVGEVVMCYIISVVVFVVDWGVRENDKSCVGFVDV